MEVHVTVPDYATWKDRIEVTVSGEYCGVTGLGEPVVEGREVTVELLDICDIISPAIPTPFKVALELPRLFPGSYTLTVLAPRLPEGEVSVPLAVHETGELEARTPVAVEEGNLIPITILGRGCFSRLPQPAVTNGTVDLPVSLICDFGGAPLGPGIFQRVVEIGPLPVGSYRIRVLGIADREIPHLAATEVAVHHEEGCLPTDTRLCFHLGRFTAEVSWSTSEEDGEGRAVRFPTADDSGFFWFFDPKNLEVMVKVLDGCAVNGHYWVFGAATTDVRYTLRIVDELADRVELLGNPGGALSPAVADIQAFPCEP